MNDNALHFAQPLWIAAGVLACILVAALWFRFDRRRDADLAKLMHPRFRQKLVEGFSPRLRMLKRVLWITALMLGFLAIARPQKGYEWRDVKRKGIDILFAVDTSRSMLAEDLTPNRLERARLGILDFVGKLEGDRVGLIPFAGSSFALCPLTLDYDAFRESLNALDTELIPKQGTDLASAIREAERLFDEAGNNHRVLVLLTDGEDLQGSAMLAAEEAGKKGMAIYTVGVGSPEGAQIPIDVGFGRKDFVRDQDGKVVRTTLDESTLKKIAEATNAMYVPLGRGAEGLQTIYQERLRLVPKSEMNQRMQRVPLERFEWPLGAAILLLLIEFFIPDRIRPKKPRPLPSAARLVKPASLLAIAPFAFVFPAAPQARAAETATAVPGKVDPRKNYNEGTEAYSKGDFTKAAESLTASLKSTSDLALQQKAYYNLGNSLYRGGQATLQSNAEETIKTWEKSIKAYEDALALDYTDADAHYNCELVKKKLEELKKQQQQQDKNQQKQDNKDSKDDKNEDKKDQDKKDQQGKDQKDQQKDGDKQQDKKDPEKGAKPDDKNPKDSQDQNQQGKDGSEDKDGKSDNPIQQDDRTRPGEDKKDVPGKNDPPGKEGEGQQGEDKKEGQQDPKQAPGAKDASKDKPKDGKDPKDPKDPKDSKQQGKEQEGKEPQPGEPKDGEGKPGEKQQGIEETRGQKVQMTPEEAKQLLEALRQDERTVIPIPQQRRTRWATPENSTNGKTW